MSSSKVFHHRALIVVFAVIMAAVMWPVPASAQLPGGCGWCHNNLQDGEVYHWFGGLLIADRCDNTGRCHSWGHWGSCGEYHHKCYLRPMLAIEPAIIQGNSSDFADVLASSDHWTYDPEGRAIFFTCSGYAVARYVLPQELARVAKTLYDERKS